MLRPRLMASSVPVMTNVLPTRGPAHGRPLLSHLHAGSASASRRGRPSSDAEKNSTIDSATTEPTPSTDRRSSTDAAAMASMEVNAVCDVSRGRAADVADAEPRTAAGRSDGPSRAWIASKRFVDRLVLVSREGPDLFFGEGEDVGDVSRSVSVRRAAYPVL